MDITSGQFVFAASEAYLIEKGKITAPVKGATLIGHGPQVMSAISMIGDDLALDAGIGVCGKNGQSVPVGVGQPSLEIDCLRSVELLNARSLCTRGGRGSCFTLSSPNSLAFFAARII